MPRRSTFLASKIPSQCDGLLSFCANGLRRKKLGGSLTRVHLESSINKLSHVFFVGVEPPARPDLRLPWRNPGIPRNREPIQKTGLSPVGKRAPMPRAVPEEAEQPDAFLVWLFQKAGLDAAAYRPRTLQRRLSACLRALKVSSTEAARAVLEQRPDLLPQAMNAVLIGVSGFFRDGAVFEQLRRSVLPELLPGRRGLRVFSAGCSDGQELYSMAMLLDELGALKESYLLGVDCRVEAIARAEAGWFDAAELEQVAPEFQQRFFEWDGARARVSPALRQKVCWRAENLLANGQAGCGWDVVLFRNVAIYLKPERARLWELLANQLRPGGVLVAGKSERPPAGIFLKRVSPCIYERKVEK